VSSHIAGEQEKLSLDANLALSFHTPNASIIPANPIMAQSERAEVGTGQAVQRPKN
jgi:hypothetical protein